MIRNAIASIGLNKAINALISQGLVVESIGIAQAPVPVRIESVSKHAVMRMAERGMTKRDAQSYIDNAMVMFMQDDGARRLYISGDGLCLSSKKCSIWPRKSVAVSQYQRLA